MQEPEWFGDRVDVHARALHAETQRGSHRQKQKHRARERAERSRAVSERDITPTSFER